MNVKTTNGITVLTLNRLSKAVAVLTATMMLAACGGSGQDDGSVSVSEQQFSGVALDPQIARATVFLDTNNNGTRDPWEPFAFTDNEGYYSYNPNTLTDYCAPSASAEQAQYCLVSNRNHTNAVVRIDGGYDILTGEPFQGQLSRRVTLTDENASVDTVVSPLTSLMTDLESQQDRSSLLNSLNISEDDLDVNYMDADGEGTVDTNLLNTALKIHKVVAVLSDRLTDTYNEIGEDFGTPNDASSTVYPNLAQQIINSGTGLDDSLSNQHLLASVLDQSEERLREVYLDREFDLPADMGTVNEPNAFNRVLEVASNIPQTVNNLISPQGDTSGQNVTGAVRALESVVIKILDEGTITDTSIDNAINFFGVGGDEGLVSSLIDSISDDAGDVSGLAANDFTGDDFDSPEEIAAAVTLPESALPFMQVGGMKLKVSDQDLGTAPNELRDMEVEFYFRGEANDLNNSFAACVKFIDGANSDGSLGDGNSRGELVEGFWSVLGLRSDAVESYSILLTLEFLGATYQAILKSNGVVSVDNVEFQQLRFDYDGELRNYLSVNGMELLDTTPSSDQECEARLPSRVGI